VRSFYYKFKADFKGGTVYKFGEQKTNLQARMTIVAFAMCSLELSCWRMRNSQAILDMAGRNCYCC